MYLIVKEFERFIEYRHKFLSKQKPRNYAVYCRNIPPEYRDNRALADFFNAREAHVRVKTPSLAKLVAKRQTAVEKLERAIDLQETTGETPMMSMLSISLVPLGSEKVEAIPAHADELRGLNKSIKTRIDIIEASKGDEEEPLLDPTESSRSNKSSLVGRLSGATMDLLTGGDDDGEPYSAGFVSFSKLAQVQASLQMIQHPTPFALEIEEAPAPNDVFWANVGRSHKNLQLGYLMSMALTATLCVFWTVPMAFFASLSSVEGLREQIKFIDDLLNMAPFLVPVFQQLAPFLVVAFNGLLPPILTWLSAFEGPVSGAVIEASTFSKLAAFMIIQTFFVSMMVAYDIYCNRTDKDIFTRAFTCRFLPFLEESCKK
jgi:hypothetical protein